MANIRSYMVTQKNVEMAEMFPESSYKINIKSGCAFYRHTMVINVLIAVLRYQLDIWMNLLKVAAIG